MRLLLFSDVHCNESAIEQLVRLSHNVDVAVGAGDFCTMRRGLKPVISQLAAMTPPLVIVPGNAESADELAQAAETNMHVLHGSQTELKGTVFFGLGGGVPVTPFGAWSFDLSEDQAQTLLEQVPEGCVLITHSPPYGAVDRSSTGEHLGSSSIRKTILKKRPRLAVCGHIHDSAGDWERLQSTPVVNAGPVGLIWDLETNSPIGDCG